MRTTHAAATAPLIPLLPVPHRSRFPLAGQRKSHRQNLHKPRPQRPNPSPLRILPRCLLHPPTPSSERRNVCPWWAPTRMPLLGNKASVAHVFSTSDLGE